MGKNSPWDWWLVKIFQTAKKDNWCHDSGFAKTSCWLCIWMQMPSDEGLLSTSQGTPNNLWYHRTLLENSWSRENGFNSNELFELYSSIKNQTIQWNWREHTTLAPCITETEPFLLLVGTIKIFLGKRKTIIWLPPFACHACQLRSHKNEVKYKIEIFTRIAVEGNISHGDACSSDNWHFPHLEKIYSYFLLSL